MAITIVAILGFGGVFLQANPTNAEVSDDKMIERTQPGNDTKLNDPNTKINNLKEELYNAQQKLGQLNKTTKKIQTEIYGKNKQMLEAKKNIKKLQKKINDIKKRMKVRSELLKDRARSYQEAGGSISYLDVLFGAQSISDFIERAEAVAVIMEADRNMLEEHRADKKSLEKSQYEVNSELDFIEKNIEELKTSEKELTEKKQEQIKSIESLKEKEVAVQAQIYQLKGKKQTNIYKKQSNSVQQTSGNGAFIWPTNGGTITTYQGMRWGSFHKGIDIARPSDYSIKAAKSGTITYAGWINGYGNTIKMKHSNGYTTQYAHLASIKVKAGQAVSQGDVIGIMGSTGRSTGIHLDFEVYQNGNLLDPIDVLPNR